MSSDIRHQPLPTLERDAQPITVQDAREIINFNEGGTIVETQYSEKFGFGFCVIAHRLSGFTRADFKISGAFLTLADGRVYVKYPAKGLVRYL